MSIGIGLKRLRSELKISQTELANCLGVSLITVNRWENGRTIPTKIVSTAAMQRIRKMNLTSECIRYLENAFLGRENDLEKGISIVDISLADTIINESNVAVFVCNRESQKLLYLNKKAKELAWNQESNLEDATCYSYFLGKSEYCEDCPMRNSNEKGETVRIVDQQNGRKFVCKGKNVEWNGEKAHIEYISNELEITNQESENMTEREKTLVRMNRAFENTINVYTEINLNTMEYRQINLKDSKHYSVPSTGDYPAAFEIMCTEEIDPKNVSAVRETVSPEALKKVCDDPNGAAEISVRYHLRNKDQNNQMESRIVFLRDRKEPYAISIVTDVTKQMELLQEKEVLGNILSNVTVGVCVGEISENTVQIISLNQAMCNILGLNMEEGEQIKYSDIFCFLSPKDASVFEHFLKSLSTPGQINTAEYQIYNQEMKKSVWYSVTGKSVRSGDRTLVYLSHTDISVIKEKQQLLEHNQLAVEQAEQQGNLSIWTYNIDQKVIQQQIHMEIDGHMGYPAKIQHVPEYFIESNSIHPEDIAGFLKVYQRLEEGSPNEDYLYRLINQKTGKYGWVHMFYRRMPQDANTTDRIAAGFSYDADLQQNAIERYHTVRELHRKMYADALNYVEYDLTMGCYQGNPIMAEGNDPVQWENISLDKYRAFVQDKVETEYVDQVVGHLYSENLLDSFKQGNNKVICEYRKKRSCTNPAMWLRVTVIMVKRPDNEHIMAFIYVEDIDMEMKRKLAISDIMTEEIRSVTLIHVEDCIARHIQVDKEWKNKDLEESFLYNEEFIKQISSVVVDKEQEYCLLAASLENVIEKLEKQHVYQYSLSIHDQHKEKKRVLFRFRYLDDQKTDVVLYVSDITEVYLEEQKKKEQLKQAMDLANSANKATTQFLSRMSHDMRTPMNGILGIAKLSENEDDINVLRSNIWKMKESGKYLLGLINDTLDFQRIQSGKMKLERKPVNAKEVLTNVLDMITPSADGKNVKLKIEKNVDLDCYIMADAMRLKQVIINLLSNAVKFTSEGGSVLFKLDVTKRKEQISHCVITIGDTGCGMSKEFLEHGIFQPFSQESNETTGLYAGSGLGLSIAQNLIILMGGKVEVQSELGVGTTFQITIDFERVYGELLEKTKEEGRESLKNTEACLRGKRVLLAEDHPLNAEIAIKLLEAKGCTVIWAKDGLECVSLFQNSFENPFDAILMDVRMPYMSGIEATIKIRSMEEPYAKAIPIIAMTANAFEDDQKNSIQAGMTAHLSKPVHPEKLYGYLSKYMKSK